MGKQANRFLLKLSGEVLRGQEPKGVSPEVCQKLAQSVKALSSSKCQLGIVIGGGNYCRGSELSGLDRSPADHMGMLATIMNGLYLQHEFEKAGLSTHVLSALDCPKVVESYTWERAVKALEEGQVVIFVGGTGNPYFTTDTAAALRASEIQAGKLLKATKVDGVYSKDPIKHHDAVRYERVSYNQVLEEDLKVMDGTAFALCRSSQIPILVFHMDLLLTGEHVGIKDIEKNGSLVQ